jgi:hypothetical protein
MPLKSLPCNHLVFLILPLTLESSTIFEFSLASCLQGANGKCGNRLTEDHAML